ncbi:MAG: NAD(P)(+) transhydrogenase (Re/Si-specific) subunit beta, partial [bacterium]
MGVGVGAITFTGSVVAWAKLKGSLSGAPMLLKGRHAMNAGALLVSLLLLWPFLDTTAAEGGQPTWLGTLVLLQMTGITSALGIHLVMAIGGADMPVV